MRKKEANEGRPEILVALFLFERESSAKDAPAHQNMAYHSYIFVTTSGIWNRVIKCWEGSFLKELGILRFHNIFICIYLTSLIYAWRLSSKTTL